MSKTNLASKAFKENIKKIISSENTTQKITTGKIIRDIGQECFNCAPTNVWGKTNRLEGKMSLLDDVNIENSHNLLVLGYGDAENNGWYGAGPTRDMRRAYYKPMLLNLEENVKIGQKGFFSTKLSEYINQFADSLDSLNLSKQVNSFYSQDNGQTNLIYGIVPVSNKENAGFCIFSTNVRKSNKDYFSDLGILLNFGQFSGHIFLPQEIRNGSPLYGPLSLAMNGKENLIEGPVKELYSWLNDCFSKFKKTAEFLPLKEQRIFPMVHVDNS